MTLQFRDDTGALLYLDSTGALMAECCCGEPIPEMEVTPLSQDHGVEIEGYTFEEEIVVKNVGEVGSTLGWSATDDDPGATLSPSSGSLAYNAEQTVTVTIDTTGRTTKSEYTATVTFDDGIGGEIDSTITYYVMDFLAESDSIHNTRKRLETDYDEAPGTYTGYPYPQDGGITKSIAQGRISVAATLQSSGETGTGLTWPSYTRKVVEYNQLGGYNITNGYTETHEQWWSNYLLTCDIDPVGTVTETAYDKIYIMFNVDNFRQLYQVSAYKDFSEYDGGDTDFRIWIRTPGKFSTDHAATAHVTIDADDILAYPDLADMPLTKKFTGVDVVWRDDGAGGSLIRAYGVDGGEGSRVGSLWTK